MKRNCLSKILIPLFLLTGSSQTFANEIGGEEKLSLWEVALGFGVVHQSYYTGTKQTRQFGFPLVKPTYRGKFFKSDEKGVRAELFKRGPFQLDLSADLNLSVDSDEIDLREGMDDIGNIVQFGPSFEILLNETDDSQLFFNVPVRGVFEIGDDFESAGYNISPNLYYRSDLEFLSNEWEVGLSVGPQFGTADYHDVYYGVDEEFATADREAYQSESGYTGSRAQVSLKNKGKKNGLLFFLRYDNIDGASFEDSPLVETDDNLTAGFVYSRTLFKSKRLVE